VGADCAAPCAITRADLIRKRLRGHPYRNFIDTTVALYSRAFEDRDQTTVLIRLWNLLERLTGTVNAQFANTVKRSAALWSETAWSTLLLQHLRRRRNAIVHEDASGSTNPDRLVWQAKRFVDRLIIFHITWGRRFRTLSSVANFLDLPPSIEDLKKERARFDRAIRIRQWNP